VVGSLPKVVVALDIPRSVCTNAFHDLFTCICQNNGRPEMTDRRWHVRR